MNCIPLIRADLGFEFKQEKYQDKSQNYNKEQSLKTTPFLNPKIVPPNVTFTFKE